MHARCSAPAVGVYSADLTRGRAFAANFIRRPCESQPAECSGASLRCQRIGAITTLRRTDAVRQPKAGSSSAANMGGAKERARDHWPKVCEMEIKRLGAKMDFRDLTAMLS